ncbi:MAG: homoprotocatechuate degradation operon regulator HpaR [Actinomycetota bacterium]
MSTGDHQLPDYSASLPLALMRARESVMRHFRPVLDDHELTEQQWRVLRALDAADEGLEVGDLAERTFLLGPSLSRMLATLERRGLVERHAVPGDQRRSRMAITAAGVDMVVAVGALNSAGYERIAAGFGADRLALLHQLLADLSAVRADGAGGEELAS